MKIFQMGAIPFWFVFAAFGTQGATPTVIKDDPPPFYCPEGGPSASKIKDCVLMPKLPKQTGKQKVAVGVVGLIPEAEHVVLVRGMNRNSLCYSGINWTGKRETVCKGLPGAKALSQFNISPVNVNGVHALVFKLKPGAVATKNDLPDIGQFSAAFARAASGLQKIADKRLLSSTAPRALKRATPGTQSSAVEVPGGGGCGNDDEGGGFCTTPWDGGGGGYGSPDYDPGYPGDADEPIPDGGAAPNWPGGTGSGGGDPIPTGGGWVCIPSTPPVCIGAATRPPPSGGIPPIGGIPPVGGPVGGDVSGWFPPSGPITNAPRR
ncbi:hypothetical protein [Massilia sp. TWR1-2-2]|uniref:hypothetical protein n=1 Tax=Massilia sp. TWR1-2-2 TaxID=2804584 RepID=UPI003CF5E4B2